MPQSSSRQAHKIVRSSPMIQRLFAFLLAPADALRMRIFECLFTLSFLIWLGRCFLTWEEWLTVDGFHLTARELQTMGYPEPWPLLSPWQVPFFAVAIMVSAGLLLANRWRRVALVGLFLCALYAQRVDYMAAFTLSKLFVGIYAVLAAAPGMFRDPASGRLMQSQASLRVLQATLILQYFAAGLAKLSGDWLKAGDILLGHVQGVYRTEAAAWALRHLPAWAWSVQQHTSLAFEVLAPVLFPLRWLRPVSFVLGIGFHTVIAVMMKDLIFFSLQMWTFYALFITSEEWRRLSKWLLRLLSWKSEIRALKTRAST